MKLYYTVISAEEDPQSRPDLSLGGFKSSSITPNNSYGNLFSDISCYSVRENQNEYTALTLVNETGGDVTDVLLYFDYPDDRTKDIEMAFVSFNADGEMEHIPNPYSQPLNATFFAADGIANAISIGNLLTGAKIGIWFKRIINLTNVNEPYTDDSLETNGNPAEADEDIPLVISWT